MAHHKRGKRRNIRAGCKQCPVTPFESPFLHKVRLQRTRDLNKQFSDDLRRYLAVVPPRRNSE